LRIGTVLITLIIGHFFDSIPGIAVGAGGLALGMLVEAAYTGIRIRPILRSHIALEPEGEGLTLPIILAFYLPLVATSLVNLGRSINSAAFSRMPAALDSLAIWPILSGLIFLLQSLGVAYNEVVITFFGRSQALRSLRRFTIYLTAGVFALTVLILFTPLADIWLINISALPPTLVEMAHRSLWILLPVPALNVLQSWYQGMILYGKKTSGVTESVMIYLVSNALILVLGIVLASYKGVYMGALAATIAYAIQVAWLWYRSRKIVAAVCEGTGC
jgi:progressive ankylosis protein